MLSVSAQKTRKLGAGLDRLKFQKIVAGHPGRGVRVVGKKGFDLASVAAPHEQDPSCPGDKGARQQKDAILEAGIKKSPMGGHQRLDFRKGSQVDDMNEKISDGGIHSGT